MTVFRLIPFLVSAMLLLEAGPVLRVSSQPAKTMRTSGITVEAEDPNGLDTLQITDREGDQRYETGLARAAVTRTFRRSFTLAELFPDVADTRASVRLEVVVTNTKRKTSTASIEIRPKQK